MFWICNVILFPHISCHSDLEPTVSPVFIKPQSDLLDVGTPFYQDGQLQVRVYWKKKGMTDAIDHVFHVGNIPVLLLCWMSFFLTAMLCNYVNIVLIKELRIRICVIKWRTIALYLGRDKNYYWSKCGPVCVLTWADEACLSLTSPAANYI